MIVRRTVVLTICLCFFKIEQIRSQNVWNGEKCRPGDTKCLVDIVSLYAKRAANGIPELYLTPIDPLYMPKLSVLGGNQRSSVDVNLVLKNCTFRGLSNFKALKVIGFDENPETSKFEIYGHIPVVDITANYVMNGHITVLPIRGTGPAKLAIENPDVGIVFITKVSTRDNHKYLEIQKIKTDFNTTRLFMQFDNLFEGDKLLSDTTNRFLNEHSESIFQEIKPSLVKIMSKIAYTVLKPVFSTIPYDDLFLH